MKIVRVATGFVEMEPATTQALSNVKTTANVTRASTVTNAASVQKTQERRAEKPQEKRGEEILRLSCVKTQAVSGTLIAVVITPVGINLHAKPLFPDATAVLT